MVDYGSFDLPDGAMLDVKEDHVKKALAAYNLWKPERYWHGDSSKPYNEACDIITRSNIHLTEITPILETLVTPETDFFVSALFNLTATPQATITKDRHMFGYKSTKPIINKAHINVLLGEGVTINHGTVQETNELWTSTAKGVYINRGHTLNISRSIGINLGGADRVVVTNIGYNGGECYDLHCEGIFVSTNNVSSFTFRREKTIMVLAGEDPRRILIHLPGTEMSMTGAHTEGTVQHTIDHMASSLIGEFETTKKLTDEELIAYDWNALEERIKSHTAILR